MKKYLIIIILIALIFTAIFSIGCEKQKYKKEIIKFDEEYWSLTPEFDNEDEEYNRKLNNLPIYQTLNRNEANSVTINKINSNINYYNQLLEIKNDYLEYYLSYASKFKALKVPPPLDDFYYKKIKQFNRYIEGFQKEISSNSNDKLLLESFRDVIKSGDYSNSDYATKLADERDDLFKESERLFRETYELSIDCDKLRREVYREYGLDDLITKWQ